MIRSIVNCLVLLALSAGIGWTQPTDSAATIPLPAPAMDTARALPPQMEKPSQPSRHAISMHPLTSIIISGFSLSYERFLKPGVSLDIPVFLGLADKLYDQGRFFIGTGFGVRYYLSRAQSGGYLSPTLQALNITLLSDTRQDVQRAGGNTLVLMGGVRYGYKFLWPHFTLDAGLGMYGFQSFGGQPGSPTDPDGTVLFPMGHFSLGIPF